MCVKITLNGTDSRRISKEILIKLSVVIRFPTSVTVFLSIFRIVAKGRKIEWCGWKFVILCSNMCTLIMKAFCLNHDELIFSKTPSWICYNYTGMTVLSSLLWKTAWRHIGAKHFFEPMLIYTTYEVKEHISEIKCVIHHLYSIKLIWKCTFNLE